MERGSIIVVLYLQNGSGEGATLRLLDIIFNFTV